MNPISIDRTLDDHTMARFAFGANWRRFLHKIDERRIAQAERSLVGFLGDADAIKGQHVLDIGSGSGLMSLAFVRLGAARVHSYDFDQQSVACTAEMKRRFAPGSQDWTIERGDALDRAYGATLGQWDFVYAWGVLHHTGRMWDALANAADRVRPGGSLLVAIYNNQGRRTRCWTAVKRLYNSGLPGRAAVLGLFVPFWAICFAVLDLVRARNPLERARTYADTRGMSRLHDWVDWLGGYPFETATPEQVFRFLRDRGFTLQNLTTRGGGLGCNEFLFVRQDPLRQ